MTHDQLLQVLKEINEVVALRDNLQATQERCNELLEENRALRKVLSTLLTHVEGFNKLITEVPTPELRGSPTPLDNKIDPFDSGADELSAPVVFDSSGSFFPVRRVPRGVRFD